MQLVVDYRGRELTGVVRPGESWAAAARRTAAMIQGSDPVPVDLSGEPKRFVVDHDTRVTIRAMAPGDIEAAITWRSDPEVTRWWSPGELVDSAAIESKYAERVDGMSPTRMWIIEVNGRSVGFVQDYRIADYPDYAMLGPDPEAIGVDYAIGAEAWRGRGLGPRVLWAWMQRARARFPDASSYFAAPDHRNAASLRILAKAGFTEGVWFDEPQSDGSVTTVVGCTLDVRTVLG